MSLNKFAYYNLKKDFYTEYMHGFVELAEQSETVTTVLADVYSPLKASTERLLEVYNRPGKSTITQLLQKRDAQRDGVITSIRHLILSYLKSSSPDEVAAAESLMFGLDNIGLDLSAPMIAQTAQIDKLVNYFQTVQPDAVQALGIGPMVEKLKVLNDEFHRLTIDRTEEFSNGVFDDYRNANEVDYRSFVEYLNAWCIVNHASLATQHPDVGTFVKKANDVIAYYNSFVLRNPAGSSSEGDEGLPEKTVAVAFEKADETVITLTGKPGEAYEIPELAPGISG